ncbi:MAG: phosphatase PAP2 family protein [Leifsonia sp.]
MPGATGFPTTTIPHVATRRAERPRGLLVAGIATLAVFALFGLSVALDPEHPLSQGLDDAWRRLVGSDFGPETGAFPMFFQYLGEGPGALVLLIVIPIALLIVRRWRSALFFISANAGTILVSQLTKNLVHRPRPAIDVENGLFGPLFSVDHGSFPSGHSVTAGFVIVGIAALIPPGRRLAWWIIAAVIGGGMVWQRTLINAHWLSDTLFGLAAGAATTLIIWWAYYLLLQKDYGKPFFGRTITADAAVASPVGGNA